MNNTALNYIRFATVKVITLSKKQQLILDNILD